MLRRVGVRLRERALKWSAAADEPFAVMQLDYVYEVDLTLNYGPLTKRTLQIPPGLDIEAFNGPTIPEKTFIADSPEGRWLRGEFFKMQDENKHRGVALGYFPGVDAVH